MSDPRDVPDPDALLAGAPAGDELPLYSARLLNSTRRHRPVVRWISGILIVVLLSLFLPWQQNVRGEGVLSAIRPQDRPQTLNTAIAGLIAEWYVAEGQFVTKGTPLVRISEVKEKFLDPQYVQRLAEQVAGKQASLREKRNKVVALDSLIAALERGQVLSYEKAVNKVRLYEAAYQAALVDSTVEADRFRRREALFAQGLSSRTEFEANQLRFQQAAAKLVEKRQELQNARIERDAVAVEYGEKLAKARSDRNATAAEVGEAETELAKLRNEYESMRLRNEFYVIRAPQDGYVVRAVKQGVGEAVKEGDAIAIVQPAAPQLAVELYVKAMDVPLLHRGAPVRLQFDGWPALVFSGWPGVSVGTFGGRVAVVDLVGGKDGKYRVLVTPDSADAAWPPQLRVGSGVYGWALLNTVPVWFELWRQVNGFPPQYVAPLAGGAPDATATAGK